MELGRIFDERWANASGGDDKVIFTRHSSSSLYYVGFIIWDHLYSLQIDAERETELRKVGRVGINGLSGLSNYT